MRYHNNNNYNKNNNYNNNTNDIIIKLIKNIKIICYYLSCHGNQGACLKNVFHFLAKILKLNIY